MLTMHFLQHFALYWQIQKVILFTKSYYSQLLVKDTRKERNTDKLLDSCLSVWQSIVHCSRHLTFHRITPHDQPYASSALYLA